MQLFCPSCQANYPNTGRCPKCGDRLITAAEAFATTASVEITPPPPPLIAPTAPARVGVGIVVALGLYLGFRDWSAAVVLGSDVTQTLPWLPFAFKIAARLLAVCIGGMIGGAGRTQGSVTGLAVGAACGGLFTSIDVLSGQPSTTWDALIGLVLAVLGAGMGTVGSRLWPPTLEQKHWKKNALGSSLLRQAQKEEEDQKAPPMKWLRIAIASLLLVAGVTCADQIRDKLRKFVGNANNIGNLGMAPIFNVQIAGVVCAAAGLIAGASTGAGFRHGFITGIVGGLGVIAIITTESTLPLPTLTAYMKLCGYVGSSIYGAQAGSIVFFSVLALTATCGWFGGELMPRLVPKNKQRNRLGDHA